MASNSFSGRSRTPAVRESFFAPLFELGRSGGSWRAEQLHSRFADLDVGLVAAQFRRQTRIRYRGFWSDIENGVELLLHAKRTSRLLGGDLAGFMKTLKYEEVYRNEYRDFDEARASIGEFLERVYNQKRLHSALGYLPPAEFEQNGGGVQ